MDPKEFEELADMEPIDELPSGYSMMGPDFDLRDWYGELEDCDDGSI